METRLKVLNVIVLLIYLLSLPNLLTQFVLIEFILAAGLIIAALGVAYQNKKFSMFAILFAILNLSYSIYAGSGQTINWMHYTLWAFYAVYIFDLFVYVKN